ncbi:hypothetical protein LH51_14680 [Nitrincola sp. A-D6]|uniref:DUF2796 domain-containing protein n=1 Tax=Nitrincola sp. A-D6 TaxID=1545442 RepID=UPI00051FCBA7|nr:DUF2796 domain-containing protein [Nitrincola sp. A-D6]KGK41481.1 hypothetical protein LH51_14680 [Nitrincola sp. A-D6]
MRKIALSLLLIASSLSFADSHDHDHEHDDDHQHDQSQLDSHVHGMAQLDVVLEGSMLLASLKAPAADLVGFEHVADGEEQIIQVYDLVGRMNLPDTFWHLPEAAGCEAEEIHVEHHLLEDEEDHDHEHEHEHEHDTAHSDVIVDYYYTCEHPEQLEQIRVNLFNTYPSLQEIQVQLITPAGQQGLILNAGQNMLRLNE